MMPKKTAKKTNHTFKIENDVWEEFQFITNSKGANASVEIRKAIINYINQNKK